MPRPSICVCIIRHPPYDDIIYYYVRIAIVWLWSVIGTDMTLLVIGLLGVSCLHYVCL